MQDFENTWKTGLGNLTGKRLRKPRAVVTLRPLCKEMRILLVLV